MENMKESKWGMSIAYGYILLPFILFVMGWFRIYLAIPILILLGICFFKLCKESASLWLPEWNRDNIIKILCICVLVFLWVYMSGIGKYVFQNGDHTARNAIFEILVDYDWPVKNFELTGDNIGSNATSLIYYIGFWLPAAVVGKYFGIEAGYGFQVIWAFLGILLFYYFICCRLKKLYVWPLLIVIFFSGLDVVGQYLIGTNIWTMENGMHLEWWASSYQYSSMTTQLFWVFNQAIPAWVCTMMAFIQRNNRSLVFILACCMLQGTFPFIGLGLLVLFWLFSRRYEMGKGIKGKEKRVIHIQMWIKDTFSMQNVVGGGIVGICSFLYLKGNVSGQIIMQEMETAPNLENNLLKYSIFIILEVIVFFAAIYRYKKNDKLYYIILICLCVIPPIKVGTSVDFCMRTSIPALVILMVYVIETIEEAKKKKDKVVMVALTILLAIGSVTPVHEFARTIESTIHSLDNGENPSDVSSDYIEILNAGNFSGVIDHSWFYKYVIK